MRAGLSGQSTILFTQYAGKLHDTVTGCKMRVLIHNGSAWYLEADIHRCMDVCDRDVPQDAGDDGYLHDHSHIEPDADDEYGNDFLVTPREELEKCLGFFSAFSGNPSMPESLVWVSEGWLFGYYWGLFKDAFEMWMSETVIPYAHGWSADGRDGLDVFHTAPKKQKRKTRVKWSAYVDPCDI